MAEEKLVLSSSSSSDEEIAALEARHRRMTERRFKSSKRSKDNEDNEDDLESHDYDEDDEDDNDSWTSSFHKSKSDCGGSSRSRKKPRLTELSLIRGVKKQARYEPEVPMTKEKLAAWRREARRVRNRESAAASRNKTRLRIDELEGQVTALQSRYDTALQRIAELERQNSSTSLMNTIVVPSTVVSSNRVSPLLSSIPQAIVPDDHEDPVQWTLPQQQAAKALADSLSYSLLVTPDVVVVVESLQPPPSPQEYPTHQNVTISRPTAV